MTRARFHKMDIKLGELCEPIAPLYNSKNDAWNGLIRIHLKNPELDGNALLEGTRIFTLELDEESTIAKISRDFDAITVNDELTIKISSKSLVNVPAYKLYETIVWDSFTRNKEYEIMQVLKGQDQEHAYLIAASLNQRNTILRLYVAVDGEIITPTPTRVKLTAAAIAWKTVWSLLRRI